MRQAEPKGCGGTTDAERIRRGGWTGAVAADCHAALEAAAFGAEAAGPSSGPVASACAALACGALLGAQLGVPARHGAYHPYLSQCEVVLQT